MHKKVMTPKKHKIAIIRPVGYPIDRNSYNSQEIGLALGLSLQGVDVDIYVAGRKSVVEITKIETEGSGLINLYELPFMKIPEIDHAIYPKLKGLIKQNHYDLVQVNEENEITSYLVARQCKTMNIPVVIYQGMYQQLTGRTRALFQLLYDTFFLPSLRSHVNLALAKTTRAQRHLQRKGFTKTLVIPVGLDPTTFSRKVARNWYKYLGIPENQRIILYIGIFEKRRNIDFMLDIAKYSSNVNITFVMVGSGPDFDLAKQRISQENISNVILPGKIEQKYLPGLYNIGAISLLPSDYEIYGMVVLESMYYGVPVISTKTAGPDDIIETGVDGILMDNLNVELWVEEINKLLKAPSLLMDFGKNAKIKVQSSLVWEEIAKKYLSEVIVPLVNSA